MILRWSSGVGEGRWLVVLHVVYICSLSLSLSVDWTIALSHSDSL
jgi:hypothetical protein